VRGQCIDGEKRQGHRSIQVAGDRIRQLLRIDFAPGDSLVGGSAAEAPRIRPGIGHLEEIIMAAFGQAEHFLDLRLGLQQEILGRPTAENYNRASAMFFCVIHDRRTLIDVAQRIDAQEASF